MKSGEWFLVELCHALDLCQGASLFTIQTVAGEMLRFQLPFTHLKNYLSLKHLERWPCGKFNNTCCTCLSLFLAHFTQEIGRSVGFPSSDGIAAIWNGRLSLGLLVTSFLTQDYTSFSPLYLYNFIHIYIYTILLLTLLFLPNILPGRKRSGFPPGSNCDYCKMFRQPSALSSSSR